MAIKRDLIVVGDKVLIEPTADTDKTNAGLYLPQGVKEKERIQAGRIVKIGPGYPVPDPSALEADPWVKASKEKYFPLQAKIGDYCLFLRDQGIEIEFENKKYIVIPHAAVLVLIRDDALDLNHLTP